MEFKDLQFYAVLVFLVYAIYMLINTKSQKTKHLFIWIGFTPVLLMLAIFGIQFLLEFAFMATNMPSVLRLFFDWVYEVSFIVVIPTTFITVIYTLFQGGELIKTHQINNPEKAQTNKFSVNSEDDCIDAMDASADYLRQKKRRAEEEVYAEFSDDDEGYANNHGWWDDDGRPMNS